MAKGSAPLTGRVGLTANRRSEDSDPRRRRLSRPFDRRDGRSRDPLIQLFPALPGRVAGLRMIAGYGFKVSAAPNQYLLVHDLCCCLAVIPAQRVSHRGYREPFVPTTPTRNPKRLTSHHARQSIVSPTRGSLWVDLVWPLPAYSGRTRHWRLSSHRTGARAVARGARVV